MSEIPNNIKNYLWDVDPSTLSLEKHSKFLIERILEYGDKNAITWLDSSYSKDQIIEILKKSKRISAKTGTFYSLYYDIPKEELECIKNPFTQKQNRF
jgi:hypothetical protein